MKNQGFKYIQGFWGCLSWRSHLGGWCCLLPSHMGCDRQWISELPPTCVERLSEYFVLKSVWKACDLFAPLPRVHNPNGKYSLSVMPMISPCDRFARWPCGLAFHFRSPGFSNLCENLKQFGKCRATFRVLEKGKRAVQLNLHVTQTPAVELTGRDLHLCWLCINWRAMYLGWHTVARFACEQGMGECKRV